LSKEKKPADWTTEEALKKLFHPKVREHLKKAVKDADTKPSSTPNKRDEG
jgi:hypothetical protein